MLRSAIAWHSTSLKISFDVSMLAAPDVKRRISRRCANRPRKNGTGFCMIGLLQDTATNNAVASFGSRSK
jgi:hypothetical protein